MLRNCLSTVSTTASTRTG